MFPVKLIVLPLSVNVVAAVALKVMPPKAVPAAKLLLGVGRVVPSNTRMSPGVGTVPEAQFSGVLKLLSAPPPSHVSIAAGVAAAHNMHPRNGKAKNPRTTNRVVRSMFDLLTESINQC